MRGYKVFNRDWVCLEKQYTCPGKFEEDIDLTVCKAGMHFCKKVIDCFNYYEFSPKNRVAEVIAYGNICEEGDKCCTDKLEIVREISWNELLEIVNTGKGCTGFGNSGGCNSGNRNSGDWNSGNSNSGDRNSGNWNSGNWNSGNGNSGKCNTGNRNTGDWNTGDRNSGNCNTGDRNTGYRNTGAWNTGDRNTGDWNTGDRNSGDRNTGDWNTGDWNSGNRNSGNRNSGDWNSGNRNSGDWNSGDWNSGDWNKCCFSNGCFNTMSPKIYMFNKPSEWTYEDWINSRACVLLNQLSEYVCKYVLISDMTDEEKIEYPEAETVGGYLKCVSIFDVSVQWWNELSNEDKKEIISLPNFDVDIFKEITGVGVSNHVSI